MVFSVLAVDGGMMIEREARMGRRREGSEGRRSMVTFR